MPKFKVRVLADVTVYKEVVVEADKPENAMAPALSKAMLERDEWQQTDPWNNSEPYIGDADNDVEPVDEVPAKGPFVRPTAPAVVQPAQFDKPVEFPPCPHDVPIGFRLAKVGDTMDPGAKMCSAHTGHWSDVRPVHYGETIGPEYALGAPLWIANPWPPLVKLERGPSRLSPGETYGLIKLEKATTARRRPLPRKPVTKKSKGGHRA